MVFHLLLHLYTLALRSTSLPDMSSQVYVELVFPGVRAAAPDWAAGQMSRRETKVGVYIYIVITDAQHPVFSDSTTVKCKKQIRRSPPLGWPVGDAQRCVPRLDRVDL